MKIKTEVEISDEKINNLLIGAREGGTNYWAKSRLFAATDEILKIDSKGLKLGTQNGERLWMNAEYAEINPRSSKKYCYMSFFEDPDDSDKQPVELFVTHEAIAQGLQIMSDKYPHKFAEILNDNDDADTADVFVQCALLGDVIYG